MASLRNIMNDDDHVDSHTSRKTGDSGPRPSQNPATSMAASQYGRSADLSMVTSGGHDPRHSPTARSLHGLPGNGHNQSVPYVHQPSASINDRRQSINSVDSMESHYGQGQSYGHTHGHSASYSGSPMRPFVPVGEAPVKLTPITGRVSRARKGVPVHTCEICRPPKTFTRAEHLRRHQLSHQPPGLPCSVPGCDKVFHRRDLLERHQQRHDQDDRAAKAGSGGQSSAQSAYSSESSRRPSYTNSPPSSLLQMQQSYGTTSPSASSTATVTGLSGGTRHWSHGNKTAAVQLQTSRDDVAMGGVKEEYTVSSMRSTPANVSASFSQPRSIPALPTADPISELCARSATTTEASSWNTNPAIVSTTSVVSATSRRSQAATDHTSWSHAMNHVAPSRAVQNPVVGTGGYPITYGFGPPLPSTYPGLYGDGPAVAIPGYDENPLYVGSNIATPTLRNMSPQIPIGQASETLVTVPAAIPASRVINTAVSCGRGPGSRRGLLAQDLLPVSLSREARSAMPNYIEIYWDKVHQLYPIIHRSTVEDRGDILPEQLDILRCAMAAVATQFLGHREHRINGSQLHAYAWHKSKMFTDFTNWSLPTMQTVLLCEYYARFRGRNKDDYQPSPRFLSLYQMVANSQSNSLATAAAPDNSHRWEAWIHTESRQRLLAACFLLSVHGMCYHEQPYCTIPGAENGLYSKFEIPLSSCTTKLWEAHNAEAWAAIDDSSPMLTTVGDFMQNQIETTGTTTPFDTSLLLAAYAIQLPRRQSRQQVELVQDISTFSINDSPVAKSFPRSPGANAYLALHYTPLHVLLAVSGDSWVFNKKIPDAGLFAEHKQRLGQWRDSSTSAIATVFAARAIRDFLNLDSCVNEHDVTRMSYQRGVVPFREISDYWGLYVCTLICWAYGHIGKRSSNNELPASSQAIRWIRTAAELEPVELQAMPGREDSHNVVGLVRDILDKDCLGGRNILYADAVGVLRKLEEVDNWSWF